MELLKRDEGLYKSNKNVKIEMPQAVAFIIERLQENGYEAFAVGGCVRDAILGRIPHDWDITTSAKPLEVKALFKRTIDTGLQHGTVTVMESRIGYEVTTYRIDGEYEDGRHPKEVEFTADLREDLRRRDFTINAMAYNDQVGLVDLFGGQQDLEDGIVRCVGSAVERFTEDALRIMRAVRFAAQLDFEVEEKTWDAISSLVPNLKKVSAERIQVELVKLLESDHPERFRMLYDTGITSVILPEFDVAMDCGQNCRYHAYSVGEHTLKVLEYTTKPEVIADVKELLPLRLAAILHDLGKPEVKWVGRDGHDHFYGHPAKSERIAQDVLKRLKFDNKVFARTCLLVRYHDHRIGQDPVTVRKNINMIGEEYISDLLWLQRADNYGKREDIIGPVWKEIDYTRELYEGILERKECTSLKTLAVTGKDLIAAGVPSGPKLGEILKRMLSHVLIVPTDNEKEILLKMFVH